jgi:hypothetical protein
MTRLLIAALAVAGFATFGASTASAQQPPLPVHFYYPHHYFPHSYWPAMSPQYPEPKGSPYMRPPAYMAYPPYRAPGWRYELFTPMRYYRGHHFWLDQF